MYFWITIVVVILSCGQTSAVVDKRFPTNRNGDKMTNVVKKDGFLFVAENGILHQLDLGLTSIKSFNTCASDNCTNMNKVLAVSGELLVLCGTGNNGVCQAFEDDEVKYSSSSVDSDSNYLTVSTNISTPAVGIAFEGQFYLGRGMKNEDGRTYRNYINRTHIADNFENNGSAYISGEEHPVYFKNVFQHNRFIFFLTNQRYNLTSNKMVSKLIRINVDEPYGANSNLSYTETLLICQAGGDDYSLLQDGAYLPAKGVLVTAFSKGDDPENSLSNSAVCVYNIGALSKELHPISVLKLYNTRITKVKGKDRYDLYPDVFIGTDTGSVIKLSVDNSLQVHVYKTSETIDKGHPITDIHIGQDKGYVVTNRKISSFDNTECSIYKTCMETMAVRNPECGWCLRKSTSTKNSSECSGGWISSLSECVSIDVSPKYLAVSEVAGSKINISVSNIPEGLTTGMRCRYFVRTSQVGGIINAIKIGENEFTCEFIIKNNATGTFEQRVQLVAFNNTSELFTYAETTIQIYKCDSYTTCGDCLQSPDMNCEWCTTNLTCQTRSPSSQCTTTDKNECPKLYESEIFIPNGINKVVTLKVENMITTLNYTCDIKQNGTHVRIPAIVNNTVVNVPLNVSFDMDGAKMNISLFLLQEYGQTTSKVENTINVTVYNCERLGTDCTRCGALDKSRYDCSWCQNNTCVHTSQCSQNVPCPPPQITEVDPPSGGYKGNTRLTLKGTDFGSQNDKISDVRVGNEKCLSINTTTTNNPDFDSVNNEIICQLDRASFDEDEVGEKNVTFKLNGVEAGYALYSVKSPVVNKIEPSFGPIIGGTLVTLSGTSLRIEASLPKTVRLDTVATCENISYSSESIICTTPEVTASFNISKVRLVWSEEFYESNIIFRFLKTPTISSVPTKKSIVIGGLNLIVEGTNLKSATQISINAWYAGDNKADKCITSSDTTMNCKLPVAPSTVVDEMAENMAGVRRRRKRSTGDDSITVKVTIKMDGYTKTFDVDYYRNPVVEPFLETTSVSNTGKQILTITGNYLNLAAGPNDYTVSIGNGNCLVRNVTRTNITCSPPQDNPNKTAEQLEVVVQLGYFKQDVGYVKYVIVRDDNPVQNILIVVLPIVGGLLLVGIIAGTIGTCKYQQMKSKAKKLEKNISDMEMKIKKVFRGEFLEMHSAMTHVSENLVEKGFPYNNYQRYTFLFLFPGEWHMGDHPLMHEPDVPCGKQVGLNQGMDTFKQLLLNKFFLVSVISTMEKQRKFFVKERSIMAGHLSVALLGKMEYFHEILTVLLTTLVDETPQKQQKTLFRRCESITENMMNNWLALSLYPHVKMHSGSPLYMLFKGTQLTMESGPIDAVTGDSKYTLSEEKLLRQDAKYNTLTLKMLVENSDEIRECKVLECDTVSQVKAKCLNQIYVNYSASQLTVEPSDLDLQWHWGNSGRLLLQDEDTTSKRDGNLLQLNTMEHYKVVDGSSMALIDPDGFDKEDYANTADITIDTSGFDHSRSKEHLTLDDLENGESIKRWHLVKPDEERQSAGCVVTDEFYITRLITTKQSVLEYMKTLFDTILDTTIPPPVKFLFDFLDNAGQRNKAQGDALHAWKSQCYLIRFWAALVDKPYYLFDQKISPYVETSMEVISQVLIESCSLKAQQYTKDSSPGKLIFKNDMMTYREKVKNYYEKVRQAKQEESELRQYLTDLNKFQRHQTHYNRHAALYSLYTQLKPYMGEILDDLEINEDTKSLGLDKKLKDLNEIMGLKQ